MPDLKDIANSRYKPITTRVLITSPEGEFLLLKRAPHKNHPGTWDLPGGGVESGQTPKKSAKKETKDETGFKAKNLEEVAFLETNKRIRVLFTANVKEASDPVFDKEHNDHKWVENLDEHFDDMHPKTRRLISEYMSCCELTA